MTSVPTDPRAALSNLLRAARDVRTDIVQENFGHGSPASIDIAHVLNTTGSDDAVTRTIRLADIWSAIASDQLYGLAVLNDDATTVFSLFPIVRSVLEHGAWMCWLLDDRATLDERILRAELAELRNDEEIVKAAARMAGKNNPEYRKIKARLLGTRRAIAKRHGVGAEGFDVGSQSIGGVRVASPTEVVEHFGSRWGDKREWLGMYDYLCGTANHPSTNAFEFFEMTADGPSIMVSADFLHRLVRAALVPYLKGMEYLVSYMGWPLQPLHAYFDEANDVLEAVIT